MFDEARPRLDPHQTSNQVSEKDVPIIYARKYVGRNIYTDIKV